MRSKIGAGVVAGLIAGVVFGMMMQMMTAPTPQGGQMPLMQMVAMVMRSDSMIVGWLYHLFNSAAIGAIFGLALGGRAQSYGGGLGWGALYGVIWWVYGRADSDACVSRDAAVRIADDSTDAHGSDGQPRGAHHLRPDSSERASCG